MKAQKASFYRKGSSHTPTKTTASKKDPSQHSKYGSLVQSPSLVQPEPTLVVQASHQKEMRLDRTSSQASIRTPAYILGMLLMSALNTKASVWETGCKVPRCRECSSQWYMNSPPWTPSPRRSPSAPRNPPPPQKPSPPPKSSQQ
ncbi:hypothetical protein PCANC_07504 [Puccinia coronata f. sp. avenae]|uniref:Uncharacterized protein n=1 Tax=Puccinia coronata f. sp. avenae TaxID=200324 RepID=A0A2N5SYM6_9BASI|nr:hypothetical protein PCANC_14213 [Puccinia coronata f. sp. avenae]PLW53247.1 hypothetical protein PCANC_07504 [Puccinia coronata f. sp. avenae]